MSWRDFSIIIIKYFTMNKSKGFLLLAIGVAAGAAAGILLAPGKGLKTRKKLMKGTKDLAGDIINKANDAGRHIKEGYNSVKEKVSNAF